MDSKAKYDYFDQWAVKRMEALNMTGVYILATKDQTFLKINVSKKTTPDFDRNAVARLQKLLLDEFRDKRFDEGLVAGVKLVREVFADAK